MVLFAAAPDFSAFYLHLSRLAHHTQDLLQDSRAGLMVAEADSGTRNPQTLARLSILGRAERISKDTPDYAQVQDSYLRKHPQGAFNFGLGDFELFSVRPESARYVAGFGRIFDLTPDELQRAASIAP